MHTGKNKKQKTSTSLQWLEPNKHLREAELTHNLTGKVAVFTPEQEQEDRGGGGGGKNGRCWSSGCFSFIMHGAQDAEGMQTMSKPPPALQPARCGLRPATPGA